MLVSTVVSIRLGWLRVATSGPRFSPSTLRGSALAGAVPVTKITAHSPDYCFALNAPSSPAVRHDYSSKNLGPLTGGPLSLQVRGEQCCGFALGQESQTAEHQSGRLAIWQCFYFDFFCVLFFFFAMALLLDV